MSNGRKLLIIPNDLRDAAGLFDHRGSEFEGIAEALRREWRALEVPSEYAGEAAVAAACERAFGELLRSRQICVEVARALRLTADTLEEADRRAAALIRVDRENGGGGSAPVPPPWSGSTPDGGSGSGDAGEDDSSLKLSDSLDKGLKFLKLALITPAFYKSAFLIKTINGHTFVSFKPSIGSPLFWGVPGGVASNPVDLAARFKVDLGSSKYGKPLSLIERYMPFIRLSEGLARKGWHPELLLHLGDFALLKTSEHILTRAGGSATRRIFGAFVGSAVGAFSGAYEALTNPVYEGKQAAAVAVKAGLPILAGAAGIGAAAALTAVGAPVLVVVGVGAILVPTLIDLGAKVTIGSKSIEDHLIDIVHHPQKGLQDFKADLKSTTSKIIDDILQAGQTLNQTASALVEEFSQRLGPVEALPSFAR